VIRQDATTKRDQRQHSSAAFGVGLVAALKLSLFGGDADQQRCDGSERDDQQLPR